MAVVIRLARRGKVKAPHYYIVVQPKEKHPMGGFIEKLGYYRPQDNPATLVLDIERADYWLGVGAKATERVAKLVEIAKNGGPKLKVKKQKKFGGKFTKKEAEAAPATPAEAPAESTAAEAPAPEGETAKA